MILAVFTLSSYFDDADREDILVLIPIFQDISEFYINMSFIPFLRRKRLTRKVVKEICKSKQTYPVILGDSSIKIKIQNNSVIIDGDSVELKNILNHCNGDLNTLREKLTMIMDRAGFVEPITSTGSSISSGYLVKI